MRFFRRHPEPASEVPGFVLNERQARAARDALWYVRTIGLLPLGSEEDLDAAETLAVITRKLDPDLAADAARLVAAADQLRADLEEIRRSQFA